MGRRNRSKVGKGEERSVGVRQLLAKAAVATGREVNESAALQSIQNTEAGFGREGAVTPPYDPESLLNYIELTPHVTPCLDAYAQNIEGYGYRAIPVEPWMLDLDSEEATQAITEALAIEEWVDEQDAALETGNPKETGKEEGDTEDPVVEPSVDDGDLPGQEPEEFFPETPEEEKPVNPDVEQVRNQLRVELRREQYLFDAWFKNCCSEQSFTKLRIDCRYDFEAHGWMAMEMIRDGYNRLKRLRYLPAYTIRPLADEGEFIQVAEDDPITPLSEGREVLVYRRFRRYVQIVDERKVYYKSPSDPRVISRTTGRAYPDIEALQAPEDAEPAGEGTDALPANEILYYARHDPKSPCPPPRWIGNLLAVLGVREADETNYFYLRDNAIPVGMLFVSGGRVPQETKDRLEGRIAQELRGSEGAGKMLVVEAISAKTKTASDDRTMVPTLEFQSMREAMQNDALFTKYDERSADRIGASFRLSPILRGYTPSTLNRATASAAIMFSEQQVFQPERENMDWIINKSIMTEIGFKYIKFQSNSPPTRSVDEISELVKTAGPLGGILPYEIRDLVSDAINRPMAKIQEPWAKVPMPMTLAGMGGSGPVTQGPEATLDEEVSETMTEINTKMAGIEQRIAAIVMEELSESGIDAQVAATLLDREE